MAKKVCTYGILAALCMVFGYLESLVPLDFIAPGVKLGLANTVALLLAARGDLRGALLVNITRILLSALLFSGPATLPFSLAGGLGALAVMALLSQVRSVSVTGMSIAGGAVHNLLQGTVALAITGRAAAYYLPLLLVCGAASGALTGTLGGIIFKKMQTNRKE